MASKSRQGSSENVLLGEGFDLGDFMLPENPTKKVVKRICRVKKNTAGQSNPEKEVAISSDSGSIVLDPQILNELTVIPQREKEKTQTDNWKRKASSSPEHEKGTIHEVNVPKTTKFAGRDGVQTLIVLVDFPKDDDKEQLQNFEKAKATNEAVLRHELEEKEGSLAEA
ncbi:hypothetical protein ACH5RR_015960 [Cinchona calisaya]|uniref:Uncharacterized protein n=1 Tax=Cinchona calisaya TaxID=153742 RepID=A0ABD2ZUJ9_9GENT